METIRFKISLMYMEVSEKNVYIDRDYTEVWGIEPIYHYISREQLNQIIRKNDHYGYRG